MLIQYVLIILLVFILWQTAGKWRAAQISAREFLFWLIFWSAVGVAILMPRTTTLLANYLGVGRGVDLVIYTSLLFVFYCIFRLFVRQQKVEKDISRLVEFFAREEIQREKK